MFLSTYIFFNVVDYWIIKIDSVLPVDTGVPAPVVRRFSKNFPGTAYFWLNGSMMQGQRFLFALIVSLVFLYTNDLVGGGGNGRRNGTLWSCLLLAVVDVSHQQI